MFRRRKVPSPDPRSHAGSTWCFPTRISCPGTLVPPTGDRVRVVPGRTGRAGQGLGSWLAITTVPRRWCRWGAEDPPRPPPTEVVGVRYPGKTNGSSRPEEGSTGGTVLLLRESFGEGVVSRLRGSRSWSGRRYRVGTGHMTVLRPVPLFFHTRGPVSPNTPTPLSLETRFAGSPRPRVERVQGTRTKVLGVGGVDRFGVLSVCGVTQWHTPLPVRCGKRL